MHKILFILVLIHSIALESSVAQDYIGNIRKMWRLDGYVIQKYDSTSGYGYVSRVNINRQLPAYPGMQLILKDTVGTPKSEAEVEIWQSGAALFIAKLQRNAEFRILGQDIWSLIRGNFWFLVKGKVKLKADKGEITAVGTVFFVRATRNSLGVVVEEGAVILSSGFGSKIIRQGEYGVVEGKEPPRKGKGYIIIEEQIMDKLSDWKQNLHADFDRINRFNRLIHTSGFANINTGSSTLDIREPALDLGTDALPGAGQVRVIVRPPR